MGFECRCSISVCLVQSHTQTEREAKRMDDIKTNPIPALIVSISNLCPSYKQYHQASPLAKVSRRLCSTRSLSYAPPPAPTPSAPFTL